jgi:hypothetical protein
MGDSSGLREAPTTGRICLRDPISEIEEARSYLDQAAAAHLAGGLDQAADLIRRADLPAIRQWTESVWGKNSPYVEYRAVTDAPRYLSREERARLRMPTPAERSAVLLRDGYHCRFCGLALIRKEVRDRIRRLYIVITCAACNYGRAQYTLEEVGLIDPRLREPVRSNWDGLERFR